MTTFLMVLNDGETYTNLEGCRILAVADDLEADEIDGILTTDTDDLLVASFDTIDEHDVIVTHSAKTQFGVMIVD